MLLLRSAFPATLSEDDATIAHALPAALFVQRTIAIPPGSSRLRTATRVGFALNELSRSPRVPIAFPISSIRSNESRRIDRPVYQSQMCLVPASLDPPRFFAAQANRLRRRCISSDPP